MLVFRGSVSKISPMKQTSSFLGSLSALGAGGAGAGGAVGAGAATCFGGGSGTKTKSET